MSPRPRPVGPRRVRMSALQAKLRYDNLAFFMSQLRDSAGRRLIVAEHHRVWCELISGSERVCLLAPRDHGKSTVARALIAWLMYRHGRDPASGVPRVGPPGTFSAVLFSATREQALDQLAALRDLLSANASLFGPLTPLAPADGTRRSGASATHVRLETGSEVSIRSYRTSTRGLHPDLLVLDDVLSDQNCANQRQRDLTWRYFAGTLLPMHPARLVIIGTAFHYDDLLHRLAPRVVGRAADGDQSPVHGFAWRRYRALSEDGTRALWPARHGATELAGLRDAEPTIFSREYQNDPRDDAASLFPYALTERALDAGAALTFLDAYRKPAGVRVVFGADLAVSEAAGADYTVVIVAAFDLETRRRQILTAIRRKGLSFGAQVDLLIELCQRYEVDVGIIEQNGFQAWLLDELRRRAERTHIVGHTTGQEKTSFSEGCAGPQARAREGPLGDALRRCAIGPVRRELAGRAGGVRLARRPARGARRARRCGHRLVVRRAGHSAGGPGPPGHRPTSSLPWRTSGSSASPSGHPTGRAREAVGHPPIAEETHRRHAATRGGRLSCSRPRRSASSSTPSVRSPAAGWRSRSGPDPMRSG